MTRSTWAPSAPCGLPETESGPVPGHSSRERRCVTARDNSRYGAAATAAPVLTASARPRRRRVKVFSQVFFKKLAGCGTASHGLSRLRQTQENRKIVQRTVFRKKPSSGVSWAGPRPAEDFHKPACPARESVCRPLAQAGGKGKHGATATAPGAIAYGACAPLAALFHRLRRLRPWSSAPHLANF